MRVAPSLPFPPPSTPHLHAPALVHDPHTRPLTNTYTVIAGDHWPLTGLTFSPGLHTWSPQSVLVLGLTPCHTLSWTPTSIQCTAPPALDPSATLVVIVGGQSTTLPDALAYQGPVVLTVTSLGPVGTPGGGVVTVTGSGFPPPPWPVAVLAGDAPCAVVNESRVSAGTLQCVAPRGVGVVQVGVYTPLQAPNATGSLTYAPPSILHVDTQGERPIVGGFVVEVQGQVGGATGRSMACGYQGSRPLQAGFLVHRGSTSGVCAVWPCVSL
jgi:hypothetical protein